MDGGTRGIFSAVKLFCMRLQWWTDAITHLLKHTEYTTRRVNPNLNNNLQLIMFHEWLVDHNRDTTLM